MSAESFPERPGTVATSASGSKPSPGHVPTRTCVGCRQAVASTLLVRLLLREGTVVVAGSPGAQPGGPRPGTSAYSGRGAWVHPSLACLTRAVKTRAFDRAFRVAVRSVDTETLGKTLGLIPSRDGAAGGPGTAP